MAAARPLSANRLDHWLKAISQGDRDALVQLYHATSTAVYAYALSILKNRFDAEDVLQECYVTIFRSAGQYNPQDKPMAWIMTITKNLCLKLIRQQQRYFGTIYHQRLRGCLRAGGHLPECGLPDHLQFRLPGIGRHSRGSHLPTRRQYRNGTGHQHRSGIPGLQGAECHRPDLRI